MILLLIIWAVAGIKVGVNGEKMQLFTEEGSKRAKWAPLDTNLGPVTWYKVIITVQQILIYK